MHRWCPVMLNALSKSFTCSLILILILILISSKSDAKLLTATRMGDRRSLSAYVNANAGILGHNCPYCNVASCRGVSRVCRGGRMTDAPVVSGFDEGFV